MMDSINQEWYDPDYMFVFNYPFSDDFLKKIWIIKQNMKNS